MNNPTNQTSRCMFCNSSSYGMGCPYSPHKKHVHVDNPRKCIYCGSSGLGTGCPYNPFGKIHVRGVEYNTMTKESLHKSLSAGIVLSRMTQPITEMAAFKLGLINEDGQKIKECVTDEEKASLTTLDMYFLKLRRLVGEDVVSLFKSNVLLEMTVEANEASFNAEQFTKEIKIIAEVEAIVENLRDVFAQAKQIGIPNSFVENTIIECMIKDHDDPADIN